MTLRTALPILLAAAAAGGGLPGVAGAAPLAPSYWPSATCGGCHPRTLEQQVQSHHERAFTNPVFQAQYFELVLPRASREPALAAEARACTACHAPIASGAGRGPGGSVRREMTRDPTLSGVTCDVCHTIRGVEGPEPGNGNYVSVPSDVKLGPLQGADNAHHAYSPLQSRSELCGTCHEATNHHGLRVKATYSEWRESPAARAGVQCQDCHMTRDGLVRAAAAGAAGVVRYTHRFPGTHSRAQVEGAIRLDIAPGARAEGTRRLAFDVTVDSTRSGHRFPTGSADLRLLWLEVTARAGERVLAVPLARADGPGTVGRGEEARSLGKDVAPGSRLYRALFVDERGQPTLQSWDARRIAFDNRLPAGGTVREAYALDLPTDVRGPLTLEARLRYLAYPASFAAAMDLPPAEPVEVARATLEVP